MRLITALLIGFFAAPAFAQVASPPAQPSDVTRTGLVIDDTCGHEQ